MISSNNAIQNKLLMLISSPNIKLYSRQERQNLAVIISSEMLYQQFIPEILAGADKHIRMRINAVIKRASRSPLLENTEIIQTAEALFDEHFRKQRNKGLSKEETIKKIISINNHKKPINLVGLMFTRKNISPMRTSGGDESLTDLAEIISLVNLNSFAALVDKFYPWGIKYIILSEGKRYAKTFDYEPKKAIAYQGNLLKWIKRLNLKYLSLYDYEDFLREKLSPLELKIRQDSYHQALKTYNELMLPILDPMDMNLTVKKAIIIDPKKDQKNPENNFVPVWRSVLNSLPYPSLQKWAKNLGREYDQVYRDMICNLFEPRQNTEEEILRQQIIKKSWTATIEHNAQELGDAKANIDVAKLIGDNALRTSINPKAGICLGINMIRETTSRVQPWHGTGFLEIDNSGRLVATVLSKLELESMSTIPIYIDKNNDQPFCYASREAANLLVNSKNLVFNMSTRL